MDEVILTDWLFIMSIVLSENTYRVCADAPSPTRGLRQSKRSFPASVKLSALLLADLYRRFGLSGTPPTQSALLNQTPNAGAKGVIVTMYHSPSVCPVVVAKETVTPNASSCGQAFVDTPVVYAPPSTFHLKVSGNIATWSYSIMKVWATALASATAVTVMLSSPPP